MAGQIAYNYRKDDTALSEVVGRLGVIELCPLFLRLYSFFKFVFVIGHIFRNLFIAEMRINTGGFETRMLRNIMDLAKIGSFTRKFVGNVERKE